MPGKVVAVSVEAGQIVAAGDALVVMEAMKMEHTLRSSADAKVRVATGGTRTHFSCDGCAVLVIPVALAIFNHASLIFTYILMRAWPIISCLWFSSLCRCLLALWCVTPHHGTIDRFFQVVEVMCGVDELIDDTMVLVRLEPV